MVKEVIAWTEGFGVANTITVRPVTRDTLSRFQSASPSRKTMAATWCPSRHILPEGNFVRPRVG